MNAPLSFFDKMRFIFTFSLRAVPAYLTELIPNKTRIFLNRAFHRQALLVLLQSVNLFHTAKLLAVGATSSNRLVRASSHGGSDKSLN